MQRHTVARIMALLQLAPQADCMLAACPHVEGAVTVLLVNAGKILLRRLQREEVTRLKVYSLHTCR